jgi:hypothetical protein
MVRATLAALLVDDATGQDVRAELLARRSPPTPLGRVGSTTLPVALAGAYAAVSAGRAGGGRRMRAQ